jgi:glutamate/aspartate transport system substrate-binding protein
MSTSAILGRLLAAAALAGTVPLTSLPAQAETTLQRIVRSGNVIVGYRESSIPFSYVYDGKSPAGYAIDLCRQIVGAIGKQLGRELKIEYRPVTSANRLDRVAAGEVDLECGSTTNNAERRTRVTFTVPHFITSTRFMVREDSGISSHAELHRATIVTTRGSTAEKLFRDLHMLSKLQVAPDHAAAFAMLEAGKADAFMMDDILLAGLRAGAKEPDRYRILDQSYRIEALAIMLASDDPGFKMLVDNEMKRLINAGEVAALYRKWFEQPIPPQGLNLRWPMGHLLRNSFRFPSDWAPD